MMMLRKKPGETSSAHAAGVHLPEGLRGVVNEGLVVGAHILVRDGRQYSDFVEGILLLLVAQFAHLDLFKSVDLSV